MDNQFGGGIIILKLSSPTELFFIFKTNKSAIR